MALCDKWVALKIVEFLVCVACLVAKRVSQDDEARLALLLQKLSREWSLLTSVTWDSVGGAFANAVYGGYLIITFGLMLGRVVQEVPRGRRVLEGFFLGLGMLLFIILGGLELASLDSVPHNLIVNASVLGALSLLVAALFLIDLMGPRIYTAAHHSQTEPISSPRSEKKVSIATQPVSVNGLSTKDTHILNSALKDKEKQTLNNQSSPSLKQTTNGHIPERLKEYDLDKEKLEQPKDFNLYKGKLGRPKDLDLEKGKVDRPSKKDESPSLFDSPQHGYIKFDDEKYDDELQESKFGSIRTGLNFEGGNYIRLSDPLSELHYEQELSKFNEAYFRKYLESVEGKFNVKEAYLPEPQSPIFAKVKSGRLTGLYDDLSPSYYDKNVDKNVDKKRSPSKSPSRAKTVSTPTLQQLEDYLKASRTKRGDTPALFPMEPIEEKESGDGDRASGTPTDRGYVQYAAGKWPEKRDLRTPRHSPTD